MNKMKTELPAPLVSIIINNYNYGRYLSEAIDSALNQSYRNIEVIVVDDGSTDNSREIISGYGDRIIPVIKENGGQASAFNAGISRASGDIVCLLDSDDFYKTNKASTVVGAFLSNPQCGFLVHQMLHIDSEHRSACARECLNNAGKWASSGDYRNVLIAGKSIKFALPATSALCFRKTVLERICPVPEELRITADNFLKAAGLMFSPLIALDDPLSYQRIHGENAYTNQDRSSKSFRKKSREISKNIALGLYRLMSAQKTSRRYLLRNIKTSIIDLDACDLAESLLLLGRLLLGSSRGR